MKKLNICIRKVKTGQFKGSIDIILLDFFDDVNHTRLQSFSNVGGINSGFCHSSGDYDYFRDSTENTDIVTNSEAKKAFDVFKSIYSEYNINIKNRLTNKLAK